jgi:hypothetical protein
MLCNEWRISKLLSNIPSSWYYPASHSELLCSCHKTIDFMKLDVHMWLHIRC